MSSIWHYEIFIKKLDKYLDSRENALKCLKKSKLIKDFYDKQLFVKDVVSECGEMILFVENPTEEVYKLAVKENYNVIKFVENLTLKICKPILKNETQFIKYFKKITPEILDKAYKYSCDYEILKYIDPKLQTEELCLIALDYNLNEYKYIVNPTFKINKFMLLEDVSYLDILDEITPEIIKFAFERIYDENFLELIKPELKTQEICDLVIEYRPYELEFVDEKFQTNELCEKAFIQVDYCSEILQYIKYPSLDFFKYVNDTYNEPCLENFNKKSQYYELCLYAVELNGDNFEFVNKELQTYEMCNIAVNYNYKMFQYVDNKFKNELFE